MLNTEGLFNKMLEHFPKWMDIRKRATKSVGGQLLESVAEETATLKETLEEFKKDFFIESYFGKEEDVVDFVYKIQVGDIDISVLNIISHNLTYTDDLNVFYKQKRVFYYENGYLFFRIEDIGDDKIEYTLNDYYFVETPEKMHVWNIFDEFATFVGLERHEWETNKQLENRILNVFKDKMNNTETGLKHAIYTELMELDPTLDISEIKIEGVTPDNLRKKYDEFSTVLDKLATINKDSYKYKKWDVDPWFYSIRSIDYIPHAWDVVLDAYKDGVGKTDDLKILLSTTEDTTDASILFYRKNTTAIDNYLKTNNVTTNVELNLTRHNEELSPISSRYKITASKAIDIAKKDISFQYSDVSHKEGIYPLSDLIAKDDDDNYIMSDVQIDDYTILPANKKFKLRFLPKDPFKRIIIKKCDFVKNNKTTSLLEESGDFVLSNGELVYKHCKIYADSINAFASVTNLKDTIRGLSIQTEDAEAQAVLNIDGMGLEHYYFTYGCDMAPISNTHVTFQNFNVINNEYVSYNATGDTTFRLEIEANSIRFKTSGSCQITIYKDGEVLRNYDQSGTQFFNSEIAKTRSQYIVEIKSLNNFEKLTISDLMYTSFEIKESLKFGEFAEDSLGVVLPNLDKNELYIDMRSYFENAPYISSVYVGAPCDMEISYETTAFDTDQDSHLYISQENMQVDLIAFDSTGMEDYNGKYTVINYNPHLEFKATSSSAYIQLDTRKFIKINKITTDVGNVKTVFKNGEYIYMIELRTNNILSTITIDGVIASNIKTRRLIDLFNVRSELDEKLYVTNLFDGFIAEKNNQQFKYKLSDIEEIKNAFKYGMFNFVNASNEFNQNYIRDLYSDSVIISTNGYNGSIKNACLKLKDKQTYVAYNEHKMIQQKKTMIQIEDTFSPFIPTDNLFYYELTCMSPNVSIQFHDFNEIDYSITYTGGNWSIGKKYICLEAHFDITDSKNFLSDTLTINKEYKLEKSIAIDFMTELDNGTIINLCKYVIKTPEGIHLNYSTVNHLTVPIEEAPDFYATESMFKQYDGFNKLDYCNVDNILEFYAGTPNTDDHFNITPDMYTLLKEEGIIVWKDSAPAVLDYSNIYIQYTIKIPSSFTVDDSLLYEKTNHTIEGYSFVKRIDDITDIKNDTLLDLSNNVDFLTADKIIAQCTNPSFDAYLEKDGIRFKRTINDNALYAKSGYYYVDGLEYYLFAEETSEKTDKVINVEFGNTSKDNQGIHLQKASNNYINNSLLSTEGIGNIYSKDFTKNSHVFGASSLNAITACSSFNHWKNVGTDLSLVDAHNGVGISLSPFIKDGYAYIDITNSLFEKTLVSLYASGDVTVFIGKEKRQGDLKYPNSASIEILLEIKPTMSNNNILSCTFEPDASYSYYLVAKGSGVIDDIVICENNITSQIDYHKKNISVLGLSINEQIIEEFVNRLFFYNTSGYKNLGAEIDNKNTIINSALINWGLTKVKEYDMYDDWNYCELNYVDIENNMLVSKGSEGYVMTEPIFTGDLNMLKSLIVKINDVQFDQTSGFTTYVYSSNDYYGTYELKTSFKDNIGTIKEKEIQYLGKYIKIKVQMPQNKIINTLSLFAEYKESETAAPVERVNSNGQLLSEIYDGQYQAKYKLTDINIEKISNISDVQIQIRASRANKDESVWTDWKTIELNSDLEITNSVVFDNYRFFQLKISLKRKDAYVKIKYLDLKVVR